MPINPGDMTLVTRNLQNHAVEGIDAMAHFLLEEDRRRTLAAYAATNVAFNAFHAEQYRMSAEGAMFQARLDHEVPDLHETPVDRWMARLGGRTSA